MRSSTRVIRFHRTGGPEVLQIDEIGLPAPQADEVVLLVEALALCRTDLLWREGNYLEDPVLPARIGHHAAGVVQSVGSKVKSVQPGDRVSTFPAWSLVEYGVHGQKIVYPARALLAYPPKLSPEEATCVNTELFLAYFTLKELAGLQRGQYVVVTAATASTGTAALEVANVLGGTSIALTRSESKRGELVAAGADHVIVVGEEDVRDTIIDITDGRGADLIYDGVGGPGLEELAWATKRLGRIVTYGALGAEAEDTRLPLGTCLLRGVKVHAGLTIFDYTGNRRLRLRPKPGAINRAKAFIARGLAEGSFRPNIGRVFNGLEEYRLAHEYMAAKHREGKVVVSL
ncbi:MAG: zinc-dependent alcohol dehydrogenase family protein [Verrucomicrobia bacterium]|nr:zinc-dependent alcohol dehydrogenase family protein [Verrucomicrobiota bacterium]